MITHGSVCENERDLSKFNNSKYHKKRDSRANQKWGYDKVKNLVLAARAPSVII